jgi:small subunit ribosomal protein S8
MAMTDPIADMLTRIRNASSARHEKVEIPASKIKRAISQILKEEGYIRDFEFVKEGPQGTLRLYLKYGGGREREKVITGIKRISRPGLRVYVQKDEIPRVLGGLGVAILSTPKGIVSDRKARVEGLGGEVLCFVW